MSATSKWLEPRVVIPSVVALVAIVALITVLLVGGGSNGGSAGTASPADAASVTSTTVAGAAPTTTEVPSSSSLPSGPYTTPTMPVVVEVPESGGKPVTDGVLDGTPVTVRALPESGSLLFGVEARLCRGDRAVVTDGDFSPTLGGNCIAKPLSAQSDAKVSILGQEPYGPLDVTFRVGVGSTTFMTQYDGTTTITCGPSSPCQIVLKLQYPKGFGFQGIPVSYR